MRHSRFALVIFAALCCLLFSSQARAQHAYGYASINFDTSTNEVTGYASTELDYDTATTTTRRFRPRFKTTTGTCTPPAPATGVR